MESECVVLLEKLQQRCKGIVIKGRVEDKVLRFLALFILKSLILTLLSLQPFFQLAQLVSTFWQMEKFFEEATKNLHTPQPESLSVADRIVHRSFSL